MTRRKYRPLANAHTRLEDEEKNCLSLELWPNDVLLGGDLRTRVILSERQGVLSYLNYLDMLRLSLTSSQFRRNLLPHINLRKAAGERLRELALERKLLKTLMFHYNERIPEFTTSDAFDYCCKEHPKTVVLTVVSAILSIVFLILFIRDFFGSLNASEHTNSLCDSLAEVIRKFYNLTCPALLNSTSVPHFPRNDTNMGCRNILFNGEYPTCNSSLLNSTSILFKNCSTLCNDIATRTCYIDERISANASTLGYVLLFFTSCVVFGMCCCDSINSFPGESNRLSWQFFRYLLSDEAKKFCPEGEIDCARRIERLQRKSYSLVTQFDLVSAVYEPSTLPPITRKQQEARARAQRMATSR